MSTTLGMASVFALSTLLLSPLALAEESQTFVAQQAARAAAFQQNQAEMSAKTQHGSSEQPPSASLGQSDSGKDS
ncbi:hypothetical protein [Pseudomonas sp. MWU13-2105]|uniref:hypothetical protein n=1 Tax=Pseudomonas sp. MWU13-2105 TaxID=2935074 RepID=UPI0020107CD3|nr:hypothetical protein [Pseudomonas sp. MWU13-2105]